MKRTTLLHIIYGIYVHVLMVKGGYSCGYVSDEKATVTQADGHLLVDGDGPERQTRMSLKTGSHPDTHQTASGSGLRRRLRVCVCV